MAQDLFHTIGGVCISSIQDMGKKILTNQIWPCLWCCMQNAVDPQNLLLVPHHLIGKIQVQ